MAYILGAVILRSHTTIVIEGTISSGEAVDQLCQRCTCRKLGAEERGLHNAESGQEYPSIDSDAIHTITTLELYSIQSFTAWQRLH